MRPRTIFLGAAALLIVGMMVFLAIEVNRGGTSSKPADDRIVADRPERGATAAKRAAPAPRPERVDDGRTGPETRPPAPDPEVEPAATGRPTIAPRAATASMAPAPATSNTDPAQDEKQAEATASYDRGDYQAAQEKALEVLKGSPRNIKMLRVVVSTSCMFGDMDRARELNARLPRRDQAEMSKRCKRFGEEL